MTLDGILKYDLAGTPRLHVSLMHGHIGIRIFDSGDTHTINSLTIWVEKEHEDRIRRAADAFNAILMEYQP